MGQLMYLANVTRPDTSFSVSRIVRQFSDPRRSDREREKRVVRCISVAVSVSGSLIQYSSPTANHYTDDK